MTKITWSTELTCVGMQFRWKVSGRETLKRACPFPVELQREPDNDADENAIKVLLAADRKLTKIKGKHLGYLRRNIAALLAPKIDAASLEAVKLWVTDIDVEKGEATISARFSDVPAGTAGKKPRTRKRPPGAP